MRNVNIMNTWTMFVFNLYPILILASAEKNRIENICYMYFYLSVNKKLKDKA